MTLADPFYYPAWATIPGSRLAEGADLRATGYADYGSGFHSPESRRLRGRRESAGILIFGDLSPAVRRCLNLKLDGSAASVSF